MNLLNILLEVYNPSIEYSEEIDKLRKKGAKFIGSGDYGSTYELNGKAIKVTTDIIEIEHAKKLKGVPTDNLARIYKVEEVGEDLGIITMELLEKPLKNPPKEFYNEVREEAEKYGISTDMLDIRPENIMYCPKYNRYKLVDI